MKKVYVITRHQVSNYGSLLQSYATQTVIENMGYNVQILDYIREDEDYRHITNVLLNRNPRWSRNIFTRCIYKMIQKPEHEKAGKKFRSMQKKYLHLTKKISKAEELAFLTKDADVLMTGSDQVWGPIGDDLYDPNYFLEFSDDGVKKVSYAASFGRTEFSNQVKEKYACMLKEYTQISVREKSAVDLLESIGICGVDQVLDPTLLLPAERWSEMIPVIRRKKYVLIYQLHKNKAMDKYAKKLAQKVNLPLIRVTATPHQVFRSGKTVLLPSIGEYLWYIKNAEYMITDSFHGTAFAINFGTQFINVLSHGKNDKDGQSNIVKTKTRNQSILELTGLSNRVLSSFDDYSMIEQRIDFAPVHRKLSVCRKESLKVLKKLLEVSL